MNKKAFTLVEVLLVIVIIAILTAVVLVAINPARQIAQARNTERRSSVSTIINAISQYEIDNAGQLPTGVDANLRMLGTDLAGCDISCGGTGGIGAVAIDDNTQIEFDLGAYINTQWDAVNSWLELTPAGQIAGAGTYTSQVTDATDSVTWDTIAWTPERPMGKQLPNSQATEVAYSTGNADMSSNVLLTHLNETAGAIVNSSGVGNDCALTGTLYNQAGFFGTSIGFDGAADEINCGNDASLNLTTDLTIEFWINGDFGGFPDVITKGDYTESYSVWINATGLVQFDLNGSNFAGAITIPTNEWHHVALTYGAGQRSIYVDGVLDTTAAFAGPIDVVAGDLTVSSVAWSMDGEIDELAVYNTAFTAPTILDHYKRGALRLAYQVRSCDDAACVGEAFIGSDGTAGTTYSEINNAVIGLPGFPLVGVAANQYFQYQAQFTTYNNAYSPEVSGTTIAGTGAGGGGGETPQAACLDLTLDLSTYLPNIPIDKGAGSAAITHYAIRELPAADRVEVISCSAELGESISASR